MSLSVRLSVCLSLSKRAYPLGDEATERLDRRATGRPSPADRWLQQPIQSAGDRLFAHTHKRATEPVAGRSTGDRRSVGQQRTRLRMRSVLCFAETPIEMDDEMMFFTVAALIVANELLFGEGGEKYKRVHRYWVRPWIGRRDNIDTAFTLMRELQAVSKTLGFFGCRNKCASICLLVCLRKCHVYVGFL